MSQQYELFYDDENDAIRACVQALGGSKMVGHALWPEKTPDSAGQRLRDSLNETLSQKLGLSESLYILRKASDIGCHIGVAHILRTCNYAPPIPIKPEDKRAELQLQILDATDTLKHAIKHLEALS